MEKPEPDVSVAVRKRSPARRRTNCQSPPCCHAPRQGNDAAVETLRVFRRAMTVARSFDGTGFRWTHQPGRDLTLTVGEFTLARYCFEAARGRPYLHPVYSTSGGVLTGYQPHDHPWHLGLWFSWK